MPDPSESNPYSEENPKLRKVWKEGYDAGKASEPLPDREDLPYADTQAMLAWLEGYNFVQEKGPVE